MQLHLRTPLFICLTQAGMLALLVIWLVSKSSHAASLVTTDPTTYYEQSLHHRVDSASTKGLQRPIQNVTQPSVILPESPAQPRVNHSSSTSPRTTSEAPPVVTSSTTVEPVHTVLVDESDRLETDTEAIPVGEIVTSTEASSFDSAVECLTGRNCSDDSVDTSNSEHRLAQPTVSMTETAAGFNVGIIAGISALVVTIASLMGVVSFLIYRHFSWNRPQTLSDKFSNDESNGYIDDTVFRENSEEMYSLDNDSFLNSLEAMTIQNYWTDHVKHTKL